MNLRIFILGILLAALGCSPAVASPERLDAMAEASTAGAQHVAPHRVGAGAGNFAFPIGPATINGLDAGTYPGLTFPPALQGGGIVAPGSAPSFTLYVNKGGNDANQCSIMLPCLTLGRGTTVAASLPVSPAQGVLLHVGMGTYAESLSIPPYTWIAGDDITAFDTEITGNLTIDTAKWVAASVAFPTIVDGGISGFTIDGTTTLTFTGVSLALGDFSFGTRTYAVGAFVATGDATAGGYVNARQTEFSGGVALTACTFDTRSLSLLSNVTIASTASRSASWYSGADNIGGQGAITITIDSTAGHTVSVTGAATQIAAPATLLLKGSGTSYEGTSGFVPSTVTLSSAAPAPIVDSPLVGLNSVLPSGSNATSTYVPTANGSGGITWAAGGGGGGITAGTGDTTFSGTGSVVTTTNECSGGGTGNVCKVPGAMELGSLTPDLGGMNHAIGLAYPSGYPSGPPTTGGILSSGVSGLGANDLHYFPPNTSGSLVNYVIAPGWNNVALNTQETDVFQRQGAYATTTTSATNNLSNPINTLSGHAYVSTCTCLARCVSGGGCTAGAIAATTGQAAFLDNAGSITVATQTYPPSSADIFFANTSSMAALLTYTTSSHTFSWTVQGIASATIDWTCTWETIKN